MRQASDAFHLHDSDPDKNTRGEAHERCRVRMHGGIAPSLRWVQEYTGAIGVTLDNVFAHTAITVVMF